MEKSNGEHRINGDGGQSNKFESYVEDIARKGFISMGLAMGHELGLFEAMMSMEQQASAKAIADRANTNDRYNSNIIILKSTWFVIINIYQRI